MRSGWVASVMEDDVAGFAIFSVLIYVLAPMSVILQ
jgi:hypothetical protein